MPLAYIGRFSAIYNRQNDCLRKIAAEPLRVGETPMHDIFSKRPYLLSGNDRYA